VLVLLSIDGEALLVCLESNAIPDLGAKHHLVAVHVVGHYVLKLGPQGFPINQIKVYFFISCHLNSDVTLDVVN